MKFIRVRDGRFHSDPPAQRCGVLRQTTEIVEWKWANTQPDFDPVTYGRATLKESGIVKPCLHCFPKCKPSPQRRTR